MMFTTSKVLLSAALIVAAGSQSVSAQQQPPAPPATGQSLTTQQLNDLVAPIALYPDPLVSQILVASTYPLELVQAAQWLEKNQGLTGTALVQAAEQQNWDPSVQALVVFPDLMKRLNQDIAWTNNLGNAFLNQQADVMDAVQRMRLSAQQAGKLSSDQQQTVTTTNDSGSAVIAIQPASPQVIYVPYYNPVSIWGPSYYYPYANWYYPPYHGGSYFSFGIGINIGGYFGAGWGGWGGWGWSPYWGNRTIIVNNTFIQRNNFNRGYAGGNGNGVWSHNPTHRQGVRYTSASVSNQYGGASRSFAGRGGGQPVSARVGGRSPASSFESPSSSAGRQFAPRSTNVSRGGTQGGVGVASSTRVGGRSLGSSVASSSNSGSRQFAPRSTSANRGGGAQGGVAVASNRASGGTVGGFGGERVNRGAASVNRGNAGVAGGSVSRGNSVAFSSGSGSRGNGGGFSGASVSRGGGGSVRGSSGSFGGGASRGSSGGGGVSRGGGGNRGGGGGRR